MEINNSAINQVALPRRRENQKVASFQLVTIIKRHLAVIKKGVFEKSPANRRVKKDE